MLGTILRYIPHSGGGPPVTHPVFLLSAAIVTGLTLWVMWRLDPARAELGLVLAVPAALLLYPATGGHYAVVCLVPYLYLWSHREALGLSLGIVVEFIATQYVFFALAYGPIVTIGLILQWLFLAVLGSGLSVRKATAAITGPPGWIEGSHSALP